MLFVVPHKRLPSQYKATKYNKKTNLCEVLRKPDGIFIHVFKIVAQCGMTSGDIVLVSMNAKREIVT